jgi:hypothetical protein
MYLNKLLLILFITITNSNSLFAGDTSLNTGKNNTILNEIHSDELRNIMRRLELLNYEREYTELEIQKLSHKQIELLSEAAKALVEMADNIPNVASLKNLSDEEQIIFNAMANQLYDNTREFIGENETNNYKAWGPTYQKLKNTCKTCHRLFRDW